MSVPYVDNPNSSHSNGQGSTDSYHSPQAPEPVMPLPSQMDMAFNRGPPKRQSLHPQLAASQMTQGSNDATRSSSEAVRYSHQDFPWSKDVRKALSQVFKLKEFRQNQLEAINAALDGRDVFVLMPTGGGKSLCYQLPAVMPRRGITIVISPLLSLMTDQVQHLMNLGVPTLMLNSNCDERQRRFIWNELERADVMAKLLYVTPEMMGKSARFRDTLQRLHQRGQLARFVIDEAHC
ncbi:P-loop containing nucleoside triphosphate hydrolase protein, partial [Caulochytrium protostelioides]